MAFGKVFTSEPLASAELNDIVKKIKDVETIANTALAGVGSAAAMPGTVAFDGLGANDNARIAGWNALQKAHGGGILPTVIMPARQINFSTPIQLYSGLKGIAMSGRSAEYSRACVFNWQGASGTSMFVFPSEGQTNQSYPGDGSPRDGYLEGIQFQGGSSTSWLPKYDPATASYSGRTLWYWQFHGCAWKSFGAVWWGWSTGCTINGQTHFQGCALPAINISGSETVLFGQDAQSFMDHSSAGGAAQPHIISRLEKSSIGRCMITARGNSWQLTVAGGRNIRVLGVDLDSQTADPVDGKNLLVSGGTNVIIGDCSFKGGMDAPSSGAGGETANRGFIHITGGSEIIVDRNAFTNDGTSAGSSTPLVYASSGAGTVRIGLNAHSGFSAVARQASSGKITSIDPSISVNTAA